jgi:tetratricopeptide (TPR) repeat protein
MGRAKRQLERCKATLAVGLCTALLANVAPLGAQSDDENARIHFESGAAYLKQSDNENALREFQAAYALSKRPALLLNIANVYERMGKPKEAVDALTKYLEEDPKTPDRTTVETRIQNLKKRAETQAPPPAASSSAPVAAASVPPPAPTFAPPAVERPLPAPNRTPAYVALGIGGAFAIGAAVTGALAMGKYGDAKVSCKPQCDDQTVSSIKTMAIASDVLTGLAVVGLGVGAVLYVTAKPNSEAASGAPAIRASAGPNAGRLDLTWHF